MEPRIQYAKTEDGVSIAFYVLGDGPPVLSIWYPSHLQAERQEEANRKFMNENFQGWKFIRVDGRGFGLSDRNVSEFTVEALAGDLSAVVDHLELGTFGIYAIGMAAPVAIYFAANHPKQVSRLALLCGSAKGSEMWTGQLEAIINVAEKDWEFARESIIGLSSGWSRDELPQRFVRQMREAIDAESYVSFLQQLRDWDVSDLLGSLTMPTLVGHVKEFRFIGVDSARFLAASIPNAQLLLLEGSSVWLTSEQNETFMATFRELGEADGVADEAASVPSGLVTILFTDMEGSTTLADRLGDAAAQEVRRTHNEIVRAALSANGGSEIKHTGDGIMASFSTASAALVAAIAIQRGVAAHKEANPESPLAVYVGLNAGEPIAEGDPEGRIDLFGTSVDLAARICDHAEAGQILAANVVRELAAGKDFLFADLGETELRGFEDPVKLWELRWQEQG